MSNTTFEEESKTSPVRCEYCCHTQDVGEHEAKHHSGCPELDPNNMPEWTKGHARWKWHDPKDGLEED
jgi:hypothetical protein